MFRLRRHFTAAVFLVLLASCAPKETVYVTASVLNLRAGPSTKARVVGRLLRGQELVVQNTEGDWLAVSADESTEGWVHGGYVGDPAAERKAYDRDSGKRSAGRRVRKATREAPASVAQADRDPTRLNLSVDEMLTGFPEDTSIESLGAINGEDRARATLEAGRVAEFWGDGENLSRAAILVPVVGESDEAVSESAALTLTFVQNAVPRWSRDADWVARRLRALTSKDVGKMGFDADGKSVRFDYIKPLGAVRVLIYPKT